MTASIERQPDPLLRGSFYLLLIFLFSIYSAAMELIPGSGTIRPQLVLAVLGLLVVFSTGQFARILNAPTGKAIAVFTVWFIACIPFGLWPGGSYSVFMEFWYKAALIFFLTAGLLTTLPQANRLFHTIAYGTGFMAIITLLKNDRSSDGRLILNNTRYGNSNDLAWGLLVGLSFIGFLYLRGTRFQKIAALLEVPPVLIALSRTGSRAGMLGAGLLLVVMLWQAKRETRIKLMVGLPFVLVAILALMPAQMRLRYTTFFGTVDTYNLSAEEKLRVGTIESTESRKQLLFDSLNVTAHHPFLGVGPGNFQVAQDKLATARGERSMWHVTHNTYTQLSSEMGLPGLGIYVAFLVFVFRILNSIIRTRSTDPIWKNLRQLALSLRTAFIVFLPVAFFCNLGYNADVPILAGLTTALGFMAQKQRAIDRAAETQARVEALTPVDSTLEPAAVGLY